MPIPVSKVIEQARHTLSDSEKVFWTESELIGWYNAAVLAIIAARPDAHAKQVAFAAVAGTQQDLPADALRLIDVVRNESGNMRPITPIDMGMMNRSKPDWHKPVGASEVQHYIYNEKVPRKFYLYPAPATGVSVLIAYSFVPQAVTDATVNTATMPLEDLYFNPVVDYLLFRGFSKDGVFVQNGRARNHLIAFNEALGIKMSADEAIAAGRR